MSNIAMPAQRAQKNQQRVTPVGKVRKKTTRLSKEDIEIVAALEAVRSDMEFLHNSYDQLTEPLLVDSLIFELKAANLKYEYYINQCKARGIVCGDIPALAPPPGANAHWGDTP